VDVRNASATGVSPSEDFSSAISRASAAWPRYVIAPVQAQSVRPRVPMDLGASPVSSNNVPRSRLRP